LFASRGLCPRIPSLRSSGPTQARSVLPLFPWLFVPFLSKESCSRRPAVAIFKPRRTPRGHTTSPGLLDGFDLCTLQPLYFPKTGLGSLVSCHLCPSPSFAFVFFPSVYFLVLKRAFTRLGDPDRVIRVPLLSPSLFTPRRPFFFCFFAATSVHRALFLGFPFEVW